MSPPPPAGESALLGAGLPPGWLAAAALLAVPFIGRAWLQRRRQAAGLLALAQRRNLKFSPVDLIGLHERYWNLELIRRGHNRRASNVLYGSTPAGLVAVFQYEYELGFGVHRRPQSLWFAVLESSRHLQSWRAVPATDPGLGTSAPGSAPATSRIAAFDVWVDHQDTLQRLAEPAMQGVWEALPKRCCLEAQGLLLAATVPCEAGPVVPEHLLEALVRIGLRLET